MPPVDPSEHRIELRRRYAAPPSAVFAAWTTMETLVKFICPGNPGGAKVSIDARLGGRFHIDMLGLPDQVYPHDGVYLEFDPPRRLRFSWISLACPAELGSEVTLDFHDLGGGRTELVLVHERLGSAQDVEGHTTGWAAILDQLTSVAGASAAA